ncbi:MAG TPA: hypothetical protein PKN32_01235 [Bacteroidales bacterium]|nr:hypothetical protein [Bacteroidales bacterium]
MSEEANNTYKKYKKISNISLAVCVIIVVSGLILRYFGYHHAQAVMLTGAILGTIVMLITNFLIDRKLKK